MVVISYCLSSYEPTLQCQGPLTGISPLQSVQGMSAPKKVITKTGLGIPLQACRQTATEQGNKVSWCRTWDPFLVYKRHIMGPSCSDKPFQHKDTITTRFPPCEEVYYTCPVLIRAFCHWLFHPSFPGRLSYLG